MSWIATTNNLDTGGEVAGERLNFHLPHNQRFYFDFGGRIEFYGSDSYNKKNTIFCFKRSEAEMIMRLNGQQIASNSAISVNIANSFIAPFIVGKLRTDGYYFNGLIGEIIIYGNGLGNNEIQKIESYLSKKWGIKIN